MNPTDLLIIYLSFGAPLAVYKYLQNRSVDTRRRMVVSAITFCFWIPAAVEIGYLYLTNAYSAGRFVSRGAVEAEERLSEIREAISAEFIKIGRGPGLHDLREILDRYVGLADAARDSIGDHPQRFELFDIAGSKRSDLATMCLMRRNLQRLKRHHVQARQNFVDIFEFGSARLGPGAPIDMGIELARQLGDGEAVDQLTTLKAIREGVWKSEQQQKDQAGTSTPTISMIPSLNGD